MKVTINGAGHITKTAAMAINKIGFLIALLLCFETKQLKYNTFI